MNEPGIGYDPNDEPAAYIAAQEAAGFVVRIAESNELQLDLDSPEHEAVFARSIEIFGRKIGPGMSLRETVSRSGKRHVHIDLPFDIDPWQRIAWQSALGSDPVRELLSCLRLHNGCETPTILVETAEQAATLS